MERSNKRGKIPQQDWPSIIARYEAGETLSSIARTYDCSPPAISYIVSRSRARNAAAEPTAPDTAAPAEPQLVKVHPAEPGVAAAPGEVGWEPTPIDASRAAPMPAADDLPTPSQLLTPRSEPDRPDPGHGLLADPAPRGGNESSERRDQDRGDPHRSSGGNGFAGAAGGDQRRTLHLSAPQGGGAPPGPEPQPPRPAPGTGEHAHPQQFGAEQRFGPPPRPTGHFPPAMGSREPGRDPGRAPAEAGRPREGGTFIDQELRQRVDGDIAAFLAAFDAALAADTLESRTGLREATDRLLRAGARTRIELERLEARVPLGPRDRAAPAGAAWRQR
jgi:hypothetical protein